MLFTVFPVRASASSASAVQEALQKISGDSPVGEPDLGAAVARIVTNLLIPLAGLVAVGFLVYGGFVYITSGGDEKQIEQGKKTMVWAVIGIVCIMLSYAVVRFIISNIS